MAIDLNAFLQGMLSELLFLWNWENWSYSGNRLLSAPPGVSCFWLRSCAALRPVQPGVSNTSLGVSSWNRPGSVCWDGSSPKATDIFVPLKQQQQNWLWAALCWALSACRLYPFLRSRPTDGKINHKPFPAKRSAQTGSASLGCRWSVHLVCPWAGSRGRRSGSSAREHARRIWGEAFWEVTIMRLEDRDSKIWISFILQLGTAELFDLTPEGLV